MKVFNLPDLGEGLPDAEIVKWNVNVGDTVKLEQILVEVQTAKAIVEIPSPYDGVISILHGKVSDIIETGSPLITFDVADGKQKNSDAAQTSRTAAPAVGSMNTSDAVLAENNVSRDGINISPEVKALARKLKVDLQSIAPKNNTISLADVQAAAKTQIPPTTASSTQQTSVTTSPRSRVTAQPIDLSTNQSQSETSSSYMHSAYPYPKRTSEASGQAEPIKGDRRAMAQVMAKVRDSVVHTTLFERCTIQNWPKKTDITTRVIRAMIAGSMVEPALNAWFHDEKIERTLHPHVNIGIAIDSPNGLTVPVIKNAEQKTGNEIRADLNRLIEAVNSRAIRKEDLSGATITLSNFGMIAGIYATPIITPPEVAILGVGRITQELALSDHGIQKVKQLPLSLSFDHRAVTGGDACRFLAAVLADLSLPY